METNRFIDDFLGSSARRRCPRVRPPPRLLDLSLCQWLPLRPCTLNLCHSLLDQHAHLILPQLSLTVGALLSEGGSNVAEGGGDCCSVEGEGGLIRG